MNEEMTIQFSKNWAAFCRGDIVRCEVAEAKRLIDLGYAEMIEYKQQKPGRDKMIRGRSNK